MIGSITRSYQFPTNQDISDFPQTIGTGGGNPTTTLWQTEANRILAVSVSWSVIGQQPCLLSVHLKTSQQGDINWSSPNNTSGTQTPTWELPPNSFFLGWNIKASGSTESGVPSNTSTASTASTANTATNLYPVELQPVYVSFQKASWNGPSGGTNLVNKLAK
jgi:hypothetical protein